MSDERKRENEEEKLKDFFHNVMNSVINFIADTAKRIPFSSGALPNRLLCADVSTNHCIIS